MPAQRTDKGRLTVIHRNKLHGLCGWYWVEGPPPREVFGTREEAIANALRFLSAAAMSAEDER